MPWLHKSSFFGRGDNQKDMKSIRVAITIALVAIHDLGLPNQSTLQPGQESNIAGADPPK
jgi:hypothetical protein